MLSSSPPASGEVRWQCRGSRDPPSVRVESAPTYRQRTCEVGLSAGDLVVVRRRVRYLNNEPFNINDTFYPFELVQGSEIVNPADITRGASVVLTELGYEQVRAIDEIEARMPLPDEVSRLDLGPGTPVAVHRHTGYTKDNKPVRHTVNVLIGSKHVILFERTKPAEEQND
ncbi:MAG: UTRA domain-containing protein [Actinobacteria bacterium]|nr:UTRA domain-containing protein [Actinomycetota bacterium]